jgi:CBS domain-containing protein
MRIRDLMSTDVPIVRPDETVRGAARRMAETHMKLLPVCEGERLMGVLTDWDVICAIADGGAADTVFVRDYMTVNVVAVTPETGLAEARELMAHRRIHHLVVCDDDRFAGVVHLDVEWSELTAVPASAHAFAAAL